MRAALVSGQARVAVFLEGSQAWCIQPQSSSPQPVSQGLLPYLFGDTASAGYHPDATLAKTGEALDRACREERGLSLALISMDPASSETTRELADDALEELLEHPHVSEFIENRLFSRCLPENAQWHGNAAVGGSKSNVRLHLLKGSVVGAQEAIGKVRSAWNALPEELFGEPGGKADFEWVLEDTGAFRVLAIAISGRTTHGHAVFAATPNPYRKSEAQLWLLSDRRYQAFANSQKILVEWIKSIPSAPRVSGRSVAEDSPQDAIGEVDDRPVPSWAELIERIQQNDPDGDGLEELYRIFSRGVRFYLQRQLGAQNLNDRVHDTFLVVVQAIRRGELREPDRLMGYARTIVRQQMAAQIGDDVLSRRQPDASRNPEQAAVREEHQQIEVKVLKSLAPRDREILMRFYLWEQPAEQICAELGLTDTQFRLLRSRARARFGELCKRKPSEMREDSTTATVPTGTIRRA
ncbi:MAG TPA: sigma-70 family RNA polymerase sigma factor [Bryobacteraceae bacterium]|nr:sigma-70 family RNA polymerase sigma factor [Bryobacteraceae bacterium]